LTKGRPPDTARTAPRAQSGGAKKAEADDEETEGSAPGCVWLTSVLAFASAHAEPAEVIVGSYINRIQDLSFRENRYTLDFYIWFRWKAEGALAEYKPLESFEIMNGRIDSKSSVVEKKIGDVSYASARVTATLSESWELANFPFDWHRPQVRIEDSVFTAHNLVFVPDRVNSRLGDEIAISGWTASNFDSDVQPVGLPHELWRYVAPDQRRRASTRAT
jgi:hypothetical protein